MSANAVMDELMKNSPEILRSKPGELVEGTVVFKGKNKLLLDICGVATGIISGRGCHQARTQQGEKGQRDEFTHPKR